LFIDYQVEATKVPEDTFLKEIILELTFTNKIARVISLTLSYS